MNGNMNVIPGEPVGKSAELKAGSGTYEDGDDIYSALVGFKEIRSSYVNVVPIRSVYIPREGDQVIGIVTDIDQSLWVVDVKAPAPAVLRSNDTPWKVDFGDAGSFLTIGDAVLARIKSYDEIGRIQLTMSDRNSRKIGSGYVIEIMTTKVAKVIGKEGAMVNAIKKFTECKIFIGQNGRVWIDGERDGVSKAIMAIKKVEKEDVNVEDIEKLLG
ncbi:MAG: exosome complex RNA-binding protein Rrp4 [Candidatus Thermoplasmatota archaeon]|nr:exosome complex RNA-binding protein Rrp4 [Candidatus Thermoplasmatota archaeon]